MTKVSSSLGKLLVFLLIQTLAVVISAEAKRAASSDLPMRSRRDESILLESTPLLKRNRREVKVISGQYSFGLGDNEGEKLLARDDEIKSQEAQVNDATEEDNFWNRFLGDIVSSSFTETPTNDPSNSPTNAPSAVPSVAPFALPSAAPSEYPSGAPSSAPSASPSNAPTGLCIVEVCIEIIFKGLDSTIWL